jgi:glycosyltransferase involved in cell wall biosynthesis
MRILQITPQLPFPPDSGGRSAMYEWLRHVGSRHAVTVLSFAAGDGVAEATRALSGLCERLVVVPRIVPSPWRVGLRAAWTGEPHNLVPFLSEEMRRKVVELASPRDVDLVQIELAHMARYVADLPPRLPRILRPHNVESEILERYAARSRNPLLAAYVSLQARRLRRFEASVCARFDRCIAVTEGDAGRLREMAPQAVVEVIPIGVDTAVFRPDALAVAVEPGRIATTGDYAWPPTADGLRFLAHEVLPRVRAAVPGARLSVIGREPPDLGADAVQQGIDVLGRVPDVRPEVLRASVFVAPTRIGSGIRVKTIEALALGRAVVATPLGCAGIDVRAGEHLLVAEDPEAIADAIVALLRDPVGAQRLGAAAAARMAELYAWPILADRFDATYRAVVDGRRAVQPQRLDARAGER